MIIYRSFKPCSCGIQTSRPALVRLRIHCRSVSALNRLLPAKTVSVDSYLKLFVPRKTTEIGQQSNQCGATLRVGSLTRDLERVGEGLSGILRTAKRKSLSPFDRPRAG